MYVYIVKPGDTVQSISDKFDGWWEEFLATNLHVEFGGLKIGQIVYIPRHWIEKDNQLGVGEDFAKLGIGEDSNETVTSPYSDIQDTVTKNESLFWWITAGAFVTIIAGTMIYYSDIGK